MSDAFVGLLLIVEYFLVNTFFFFFFLPFNLLIGWQLSIWNCCKPFFTLLYNCQLTVNALYNNL
jgi:hypothetical protein